MKENNRTAPTQLLASSTPTCTDRSTDTQSLVGLLQHVVLLPMSTQDAPCLQHAH